MIITDHRGSRHLNPVPLGPGDLFGEVALLCKCNRTATVKTTSYSLIANLHKKDFDTVCRIYSEFQINLKHKMKQYQDTLKTFTKQMLLGVDYFRKCSDSTIEEITYYCQQQFYENDRIIFRAGDTIDKIYFIASGKVNITVNINDIDVIVDTLFQGCVIGCNGILGDFRHNFAARAVSNVSMYFISKDSLKSLMNICDDLDKEVYNWKVYYESSEMPYVDFRLYRSPDEQVATKDVLKLSIVRLL